jgi:transcriptional regulator with XRE-family HTH domain
LTGDQCKEARALLGWSREDLSGAGVVAVRTIMLFEHGATQPRRASIAAIRTALEAAGVEFTDVNPGVRLKREAAS